MNFKFWIIFTIGLLVYAVVGQAEVPAHNHTNWIKSFPKQLTADSALSLINIYDNGPAKKIAVSQNYLVFSRGGFLEVADISDENSPVFTGHLYLGCLPDEVKISDKLVVVQAPHDEFIFINLQNPETPAIVHRYHPEAGMVMDWDLEGELWAIALENRIQIFQLTMDEPPLLLAELRVDKGSAIDALDIDEQRLFAHTFQKNFVWDLFDPANPELLLQAAAVDIAQDLAGSGNRIVEINSQALSVYQYQEDGFVESASLSVWGSLDRQYKMVFNKDWLCVLNEGRRIDLYQLGKDLAFNRLYSLEGDYRDFAVRDSSLFLVKPEGCFKWDLHEPEKQPLKLFDAAAPLARLLMFRNIPYLIRNNIIASRESNVAAISEGSKVYDASRIFGEKVSLVQDHLVRLSEDSLFLYKLDETGQIEALTKLALDYAYTHITTVGNRIYLSSYTSGLLILQLNDQRVETVGIYPEISLGKMVVRNNLLYGENIHTLDVYKLDSGNKPVWISAYQPGGLIKDFSVKYGKIALSIDDSGIWLLDATEPEDLRLLTWFPGRFEKCLLFHDYLLATPGLKLFELEDGREMVLKSEIDFPDREGKVIDLRIGENDRIYLLHNNLGLFVFENLLINRNKSTQSISSHFPNPFNSVISIQYQVQTPGQVRVAVYNVQGHLVKTLVNRNLDVGEHYTRWDATNEQGQPVASGVYLYRVQTPTQTETQKILLIR
ncbi:MAG: hypothetical protein Kow0037_25710 [Calditrichia bacterium]